MKKSTPTDIAITPKLGSELLSAAIEAEKEEISETVISFIQGLLKRKNKNLEVIQSCEFAISKIELTLKAVNAGEFIVTNQGHIIFNDKEIEKDKNNY